MEECLFQDIASKGAAYEVLESLEFIKQITEFIRNAAALYKDIKTE